MYAASIASATIASRRAARSVCSAAAWLDQSAIGEDRLSVYPAAVGGAQARNDVGDIGRLPETAMRRALREAGDLLRGLAIGEERGIHDARRQGVDRDAPAAQFLGKDAGEDLLGALRGGIRPVRRGAQLRDAGRQGYDPSALAPPPGRLAQHIEAALLVDVDHPGVVRVAHVAKRREAHDAGVADDDIDTAERALGRIEQPTDRARVADIGLQPDRAPAGGFDLAHHGSGEVAVLHAVDRD